MFQNKLAELHAWIANVPVNSLRRVYPSELQSALDLSDEAAAQFIYYLATNNMCYIKYDFTCSCGNECTVYYQPHHSIEYECAECGKKYDNNAIEAGTMTLELKKQVIITSKSQPPNATTQKNTVGEEKMEKQKIFIVHGHDNERKFEVSDWLRSLDLEPIILHEQASGGTRSIIGKIERNSNVAAAIVLLTADDVGKAKDECDCKPRARQNVVFEAGYFIGKLSPDRVILLHEESVEIPGDLGGCIYIATTGQWKDDIRKEFDEKNITYKK